MSTPLYQRLSFAASGTGFTGVSRCIGYPARERLCVRGVCCLSGRVLLPGIRNTRHSSAHSRTGACDSHTGARGALSQVCRTLADRSILAVIASGLVGAIAGGTSSSLWPYMQ